MSDDNYATGAGGLQGTASGESSMVDTAKEEAAELAGTAADAAKDVAGTAKEEATSLARETKAQAADLYHQARQELHDQASVQQERVATGLSAFGDELGSMARNSDGTGMAADLVQRASDKASRAASWLGSRDPSGVLDEVRVFARRRPVVFIGAALLAGVIAGRFTRALSENAREDAADRRSPTGGRAALTATPVGGPAGVAASTLAEESPLYAESAARFDAQDGEASNERRDTF